MTNGDRNDLNLDDADRLPWLEPAELDEPEGVSPLRMVGFIVVGLVLLGLIVGGGYWLRNRQPASEAEAVFIPAQGGDYKIPANEAAGAEGGGKVFKGEGDTSYATSEGVAREGNVDISRAPETPLAGAARGSVAADDKPVAKSATKVSAAVKDATAAGAGGATKTAPAASSAGPMIQLGAYATRETAEAGWTKLSKRFDYVASLSHSIEKAEVNDRTVYRLRAGVTSAAEAANLCGRLKVAGENCLVVR